MIIYDLIAIDNKIFILLMGGIIMIDPYNLQNVKKLIINFSKGHFIKNYFSEE